MRFDPDLFFVGDFTEHTSQGDLYEEVPFVWWASVESAEGEPAGRRPRPSEADPLETSLGITGFGLVCNYTCGFVAQPPGTPGYAHPFRLVAPVMPLRVYTEVLEGNGFSTDSANAIIRNGGSNGFLYVPGADLFPDDESEWAGHAIAMLYRMAAVSQSVLDARRRIARLSPGAQQHLASRLAQVVSPYWVDPEGGEAVEPDRSDSWNPAD